MFVAHILGPVGFGTLKAAAVIPTLSKYGSLGLDAVVQRELPHLRTRGEHPSRLAHVRNVGFTFDFVWAAVLALALVSGGVAWGLGTPALILVAGLGLVAAQVQRVGSVSASIEKRFHVVATAVTTAALVGSIGSVVGALLFGPAGALGGLVMADAASAWVYRRKGTLQWRLTFDLNEIRRQIPIGLRFASVTVSFGAFGVIERMSVLSWFGAHGLGVYMLVIAIQEVLFIAINAALRAMGIEIYEALARPESEPTAVTMIERTAKFLSWSIPMAGIPVCVLGPSLLERFMPSYGAAASLLPWVIASTTFRAMAVFPMHALTAARFRNVERVAWLWVVAASTFWAAGFAATKSGFGLEGVAAARCGAMIILGTLSHLFFFKGVERQNSLSAIIRLLLSATGLLVVTSAAAYVLQFGDLSSRLLVAIGCVGLAVALARTIRSTFRESIPG